MIMWSTFPHAVWIFLIIVQLLSVIAGLILTSQAFMDTDSNASPSSKAYFVPIQAPLRPDQNVNCHTGYNPACHPLDKNPLVEALILSTVLGIQPKLPAVNHQEHLPLNPYLALLLSHYGHYAPLYGMRGRGLYGYTAVNNYHNNKPFGAYKIYEDNDG